ncbi:hypothetical protein N9242_01475 [Vicingaceae bacterium]|nr:hypothetical protein [Vicingaceae bacterium]
MKKITTIVLIIGGVFVLNNNLQAQAFQKGNFNLDIGLGFGVFGTKQTATTKLSFDAFGTPFSQTSVNDTSDGAASFIVPIGFEYGVSNKIGLGLEFSNSNYAIDENDREFVSSVKGLDFGIKVNYHLLNSEKNDLFIGIGFGFSKVNWTFKSDATNLFGLTTAAGSGRCFSIGVTDRIFFSDHFGIMFNLGYRGYTYPEINYETGDVASALEAFGATNVQFSQQLEWKLNGVHIGAGLAIKF